MRKDLAFIEMLHNLLTVDAQAGKLYWKPRPFDRFKTDDIGEQWNDENAGKEAFVRSGNGGAKWESINGMRQSASRIIWAMHHGKFPDGTICHINNDQSDNRIENLTQKHSKDAGK